jgi:hypothetical protein
MALRLRSGRFHTPREDGTPAEVSLFRRTARLGRSLVPPGSRVDETDLNVTRFFKRLWSETRRNSVQKGRIFLKSRSPRPHFETEAKDIIGSGFLIVLTYGSDFFSQDQRKALTPDGNVAWANGERRGPGNLPTIHDDRDRFMANLRSPVQNERGDAVTRRPLSADSAIISRAVVGMGPGLMKTTRRK